MGVYVWDGIKVVVVAPPDVAAIKDVDLHDHDAVMQALHNHQER